jgi:spermidine/putrescine transport system permease protein
MKKKNNALLTGPYLIWTVAFIVIPLILIVYYGFTDENHRFTLDNLSRITDPVTLKALLLSLLLSALATAICLVMAYPLAMILSRMKSGASAIITTIFIIPMWMNSLLRIFAWQTLLERNGVINQLLAFLHLPPQHLINTPAAIALGMIYDYLPFMLLPIYNSLTKLDWNVVNAAYDLGANGRQTFFRVIVR